MCCESSDVVRFNLGPLLQGQMRIYIYIYIQLFTYVQISSMFWTTGGSEQPLQVPGDRGALNQPKPHPSSRIA